MGYIKGDALAIEQRDGVFKKFFEYVEIKTKITSVFSFFTALAYLLYAGQPIRGELTAVFFASMFLFDLTVTAINNYIDTKTNTQTLQFTRRAAFRIICVMLAVSTVSGLYVAWKTDLLLLILGGICFLCGILYTYGPLPISRQPLGELFSGVFYGLFIPFLVLYINMPAGTYALLEVNAQAASMTVQFGPAMTVLLLSAAPVCTTANIMLANNICDVERDAQVKRHTLPYYFTLRTSLALFAALYFAAFAAAIPMVVMRIVPPVYLVIFAVLPLVIRNIKGFYEKQDKETTFILSIKNFVLIMGADVVALRLCAILY